jgi:threonine dehydratase
MANAIDIEAVYVARARLSDHVVRTPLLQNLTLDARTGGRVFVKAENLQRTGSFKFRGAMNRALTLSNGERERGIVAFSSGNHAIAVAEAARFLECPAVIIMPEDAPRAKIAGAKSRGADVVLYHRSKDDREKITGKFVSERGLTLIPPFDDPFVIAGQGTAAAEAVEQLRDDFDVSQVDQVLIPCSGGGLAAGWSTVIRQAFDRAEIITVEPAGFDDTALSLRSGTWQSNDALSGTICDALLVATPGKMTLPMLIAHRARGVSVTDDEVLCAMRFAARELKLVVEPSGAVPLAAVLSGRVNAKGRTTLLVASGGNLDSELLMRSLKLD